MKTLIKEVRNIGKYTVIYGEREDLRRFPLHCYFAQLIENRPKAKWDKEKSIYNYVYKTLEEAQTKANTSFNNISTNIKTREEEKRKKSEAMKTLKASDFFKLGDIIVNTWGYEQTNVEFYQVTEVKNKTIEVKEIAQKEVQTEGYSSMACDVLPVENSFLTDGANYQLRVKPEGYLSNPKSFYYFHKWSGRPQYKSWYY